MTSLVVEPTGTPPNVNHLVALARRYVAVRTQWPVQPRFTADRRWYYRLAADDQHEAWLLTWLPGQHTDLHDHGSASGAFIVLSGAVTEEVVCDDAARLQTTSIASGGLRVFGPHHVHRVGNVGTVPAMSLHVYAPALSAMTRYALTGLGLRVLGVETGADW
jgi:predicted metal-dependent enzyme (double-stranded beta helix superfamily)